MCGLLQGRAIFGDRYLRDGRHLDHGVRISHRYRTKTQPQTHARDRLVLVLIVTESMHGNTRRFEVRHSHRDGIAVTVQAFHIMGSQGAIHTEASALGGAVSYQPGSDATGAVAALLRKRTVRIPD